MQNINGKTAFGLDSNVGAMICYIGNFLFSFGLIYSIIVVATDKANKLARFHAWQSILCSILGIVVGVIAIVISSIALIVDSQLGAPLLTLVIGLVALVVGLVLLIMYFYAAFKAYQGKIFRIPIIGGFADKWA